MNSGRWGGMLNSLPRVKRDSWREKATESLSIISKETSWRERWKEPSSRLGTTRRLWSSKVKALSYTPPIAGLVPLFFTALSPTQSSFVEIPGREELKFYSRRQVPTLVDEWNAVTALSRPRPFPALIAIAERDGAGFDSELGVPIRDPMGPGAGDLADAVVRHLSRSET